MTCDRHKAALLLAGSSDGELDAKLARHLERCSKCRITLCSDRELFLRIDSSLRAQVNEDVRPGFLAQLRFQLSKESPARPGSDGVWPLAGAALALVLCAMFYPLVNPGRSSVHGDLQRPTTEAPQGAGIAQPAHTREDLAVRSSHYSERTALQSAAPREPEVLVPPDEQKALAQFVACIVRRDAIAQAVVTPMASKTVHRNTELPQVPSVDTAELQLDQARQEDFISQTGGSD